MRGSGGGGGEATTTIDGTVESYANNAMLTASGKVLIDADSTALAEATPDGVTIGAVSVTVMLSKTFVKGMTRAYVDGNTTVV